MPSRPSMPAFARPTLLARRLRHARGTVVLLLAGTLATACSGDLATGVGPDDVASARRKAPDSTTSSTPPTAGNIVNVLTGATLWVDPWSNARKTADTWRATRPADAASMDKLAAGAQVRWFGNWNSTVQSDVDAAASTITASGALPTFVAYNIPQRDCGGLSGGNVTTPEAYRSWITAFANGIGARKAAVILEPDALAGMDCLSSTDQQLRLSLLSFAVQTLQAKGSVSVYLDAGNPRWHSASTMASRLTNAGIAMAQGFSLNVSNFLTTSDNVLYGQQISALVGGKHFVVDTGRNGLGPTADFQWCNPDGRSLGARPTTQTGNPIIDAYLWIKAPGESDGACNGAASSGTWMPEYALGLAQRAAY